MEHGVRAKLRVHLDTDLGGDPDDVCALALLLGSPEVELVGITTVLDAGGRRAGYVAHCLALVGRSEIPVVAGSVASLTSLDVADPVIDDERFWPRGLALRPARPGAVLDALSRSIDAGATIIAIGPVTNLALLEVARPGSLGRVPVVMMGGWIDNPAVGLPAWGPEMDWNVQWDVRAAEIVAASASLSLGTLPATFQAHLRAADLPRLRASGPLGALIADQSVVYEETRQMGDLGRRHPGLPDDLLNIHWDPATVAMALGWSTVTTDEMRLRPAVVDGALRFVRDDSGRVTRVLTAVDGVGFTEQWLTAVERAHVRR